MLACLKEWADDSGDDDDNTNNTTQQQHWLAWTVNSGDCNCLGLTESGLAEGIESFRWSVEKACRSQSEACLLTVLPLHPPPHTPPPQPTSSLVLVPVTQNLLKNLSTPSNYWRSECKKGFLGERRRKRMTKERLLCGAFFKVFFVATYIYIIYIFMFSFPAV